MTGPGLLRWLGAVGLLLLAVPLVAILKGLPILWTMVSVVVVYGLAGLIGLIVHLRDRHR